jgi:hypothetical protein
MLINIPTPGDLSRLIIITHLPLRVVFIKYMFKITNLFKSGSEIREKIAKENCLKNKHSVSHIE